MFILGVTGFDCGGEEILKVIKFVSKLIDVTLFIVPMALIVIVTVDFFKNVVAGKEDDMKKNLNLAIKRVLYCMVLFLINPIVSTAINLLGNNGIDFMKCINIAKNENLSKYKIEYELDGGYDGPTPDFSKPSGVIPSKDQDSNKDGETDPDNSSSPSDDDDNNIDVISDDIQPLEPKAGAKPTNGKCNKKGDYPSGNVKLVSTGKKIVLDS